MNGGVNRPILAHQYNAFIKASLSAIGLNSARGGATFAFSHEAPTAFIKAQGDWKSDAYLVYLTLSTENNLKFSILSQTDSLHPLNLSNSYIFSLWVWGVSCAIFFLVALQ